MTKNKARLAPRSGLLFRFFMRSAFLAVFAKLSNFQAVLQCLLVLASEVIEVLANRALEFDHVIL